jgi:magnesium chelatase family protein
VAVRARFCRTLLVRLSGTRCQKTIKRTHLGRNRFMSLALVQSRALLGLQAPSVTVEVHLANGLPSFTLVGLAEVEVKEARERVRSALQNAGLEFPHNKRIKCSQALF